MDKTARLRARIAEAPLSPELWPDILTDLAADLGGWGAQLIGIAGGRIAVDIYGGISSDLELELHRWGGGDPVINPRAAALLNAPVGEIQCDSDFLLARDRDNYRIYREFFDRVDAPICTFARIGGGGEVNLALAVVHSQKQGPPESHARRQLREILPTLESAVNLQLRIERQSGASSFGVLDSMALPAFSLDFAGRIVRTSEGGEAMLAEAGLVRLASGRLEARHDGADAELQAAILHATHPTAPKASTVLLRARDGSRLLRADVAPLMGAGRIGLGERALVVLARGERQHCRAMLERLGLTRAEADVAAALADGLSLSAIAQRRNVSVGTTRAQVKAIFAKLGVSRQAELAAKLAAVA